MNAEQQTQEQLAKIRQEARGDSTHHLPAVPREIAALKERIVELEAKLTSWRGFIHRFSSISSIHILPEPLSSEVARLADELLSGANPGQPLLDRLKELESERDGMSHDLKQVREALGCDGSDLPQLLGAIDRLKSELLSTRQKLPTTDQAMVYQSLLMKFKSAESRLKEAEELLGRAHPGMHTCETGQWFTDRDDFLANKQK